jgi:hypothetical protein
VNGSGSGQWAGLDETARAVDHRQMDEYLALNRANWDERAPAHAASADYPVTMWSADSWRHRWYYTPVEKTTLYLPADLKTAVKRAAAERGVSEAEIIRESIRTSIGGARPRPRGALYSSGQPIARHAEEMLAGFGER